MIHIVKVVTIFFLVLNYAFCKQCFRGAVLENTRVGFNGEQLDPNDPYEYVRQNLQVYEEAASRAEVHKFDILVTAEQALFFINKVKGKPNVSDRDELRILAQDIPDPKDGRFVPCIQAEFDDRPILKNLSCIARKNNIYFVADITDIKNCSGDPKCPSDGIRLFNCQVAFDRQGIIIGRYHKHHLYGEFMLNQDPVQDFRFFDSDFGVRFGLYICWDRVYKDPIIGLIDKYNVTSMALSTWFGDEYPFYLSTQIDSAWSQKLKVNILTSNVQTSSGSGLFSPHGYAEYHHDVGLRGDPTYSTLVIANLPVDPRSNSYCDPDPVKISLTHLIQQRSYSYSFFATDLSSYKLYNLTQNSGYNITQCQGDFCCHLNYEISGKRQITNDPLSAATDYVFGVVNRMRQGYGPALYPLWEQSCFVMSYDLSLKEYGFETEVKFKSLNLSGNFSTTYVYSSALTNKFRLIQHKDLEYGDKSFGVKNQEIPIIFAGMHGRPYDRDPPYSQKDFGDYDFNISIDRVANHADLPYEIQHIVRTRHGKKAKPHHHSPGGFTP
jgi:hypothetical protein